MFDCRELFSHKIPVFDKVDYNNITRKRAVNALLGLCEENQYRKIIPCEHTHEDIVALYPVASSFVTWVLEKAGHDKDGIDFGKNIVVAGKQEKKITRILSGMFDKDPKIIRVLEEFKESIYAELNIGDGENSKGEFVPGWKKFIPAWGERKATNHLVISTNTHDLLTPSNNSSFSSCHRINGEYYTSAVSHTASDCSVIAYTTNNLETLYKVGRVWCLVDPARGWVHFGSYGTLHAGEFKRLENYIEDCFEKPLENCDWGELNFSGYLDSSAYSKSIEGDTLEFDFWQPICLKCGCSESDELHGDGVCCDCDHTRCCPDCGERRDEYDFCLECGCCTDCCQCVRANCGCRNSGYCDVCGNCYDCCTCNVCESCGERVGQYHDFCHECNCCVDCCSCCLCDCGCVVHSSEDQCEDCHKCTDCCTCGEDSEDES